MITEIIEPISTTSGKAAKIGGMEVKTLNKLFDQGYIKGVRLPSGQRRIYLPSLMEYLQGNGDEN